MNMNENLRKLLNRFAFVAVAATLAACSADELAQGGDGTLPQPGGPTASSGTVNFTNNTSMTIGNGLPGGTRTAWLTRGATFDMADNGACTLTMPEQPEVGDASSFGSYFDGRNIGDVKGKPAVIEAGVTMQIGRGGEDMVVNNLDTDLFVRGTLNVENVRSDSKQGRIIVLEGGTVNFNMEKLADVAILNYGGTVNLTKAEVTIDAGAAIMTDGGLGCGDCAINVAGKLYVGGGLTCKRVASEVGGALVHVLGNLTAVPYINEAGNYTEDGSGQVEISGESDVCVEGVTNVYRFMASRGACVHTDCKLVANDALNSSINITNGATLCASYVETKLLHISAGAQGALTQVLLPDQGVINVDKLSLGNSMMIGLYKQGTKALVSAKTVTVENRVKWEDIVDPALYVNCDDILADAEPADKSMINKVTMGAGGECSPGFTVNEPEDPDPGTDPDDPEPEPTTGGEIEIPIKIDDIINEDYILKADDFAIRVNGEYMDDIKIEGDNSAKLDGVKIVNDALTIIINGLVDNPAIIEGNDYTYECWIWVENKSLLNDGTGGYGPLFDYAMYEDWANPEGDPDAEDPYGYDMTKRISESGKVKSPAGFVVRYNVYRGLAGRMDADGHGDTPYIKVSVSVQKDPDARENTNVGIWPAAYNN